MASSSTRPFSGPSSRPTSPGRSATGASGATVAGSAAAGASSRMASSPSSSFEDDLNSRSLSFWKNAMPASSATPPP